MTMMTTIAVIGLYMIMINDGDVVSTDLHTWTSKMSVEIA